MPASHFPIRWLRGDFSALPRRDTVAELLAVGSDMIFCPCCSIEITRLIDQLKRWQTWAAIVLIGIFASLAFSVGSFAFRTDGILLYLNRTAGACRELSNGIIIFMFCGMIFFMLTALLTLGEFQQYLQYKQRAAHYQASRSLFWGIGWAAAAICIAVAALVFFNRYCR